MNARQRKITETYFSVINFKNHLLNHSLNRHETLNLAFDISSQPHTNTHKSNLYPHLHSQVNNPTKRQIYNNYY